MWFLYFFLVGPLLAMICSVIIGVVFDTFGQSLTEEQMRQIVLFFWLVSVVLYFLHPKYIKFPFINSGHSNNKITLSSPYILTTKTINLEEDEEIKFAVKNIGLYEEQKTRTHTGLSIRLARGIWYRTGESKNLPQSNINIVDTGDFFITTKKIVFAGDRELLSYDIKKIVTYQAFLDGFSFGVKNNKKIRYLLGFDKYEIKFTDDYKPNCDGDYLEGIIFR
tara:strand:- start:797 stop:1462 length:666 start_codon:yes stop_codon:yes gene_type:complete